MHTTGPHAPHRLRWGPSQIDNVLTQLRQEAKTAEADFEKQKDREKRRISQTQELLDSLQERRQNLELSIQGFKDKAEHSDCLMKLAKDMTRSALRCPALLPPPPPLVPRPCANPPPPSNQYATTPRTDWDMWASRSKWPKPPTPSTPTPTRSPLEPGSPSSRGGRGQGQTNPRPLPLPPPPPLPPPYSNMHPCHPMPPGQKEWRGWGRNWAGGKGRTREGNRTGQTALAENGAERRRRKRKGTTGKKHCGC